MSVRMLAAVVRRQAEYLVCQRAPQQAHAGLWGFPVGLRQPDEALPEAARREMELLLQVRVKSVGTLLFSTEDADSRVPVDLVPVTIAGEPSCAMCAALRWMPLEDIPSLMLTPTDRRFVEFLESAS